MAKFPNMLDGGLCAAARTRPGLMWAIYSKDVAHPLPKLGRDRRGPAKHLGVVGGLRMIRRIAVRPTAHLDVGRGQLQQPRAALPLLGAPVIVRHQRTGPRLQIHDPKFELLRPGFADPPDRATMPQTHVSP